MLIKNDTNYHKLAMKIMCLPAVRYELAGCLRNCEL